MHHFVETLFKSLSCFTILIAMLLAALLISVWTRREDDNVGGFKFQVRNFSGVREGNTIDCPMTPRKEYTTTDTHVLGHVHTSPKVQKHCWRLTVLVCQCFFCFFRFRTFFKVSSFKFQVSSFKFQVSSFKFQVSSFKEGGREGGRGSESIKSVRGLWSGQRRNHCRPAAKK